MTDETNDTQAPQENTPTLATADRTRVTEMAELITGTLRRHMEGFIGQADTPTTRERINTALNTWAENVDPPQLGRARAAFDAQEAAVDVARAMRADDVDAAAAALEEATDGRLTVRRAEGIAGLAEQIDTARVENRIFRTTNRPVYFDNIVGASDSTYYQSTLDQLKKVEESKYQASPNDVRLHQTLGKAEDAFKNMDYSTCHQLIGEFLEIHKGVTRGNMGRYRSDGGKLPNYVPIEIVNDMVSHFINSYKMLHESSKQFEQLQADVVRYRGKLPHVTISDLINHVSGAYSQALRSVRYAMSQETGQIWDEEVAGKSVMEDDPMGEAEEPPEELTEAQRMIIEIARAQQVQQREAERRYQRNDMEAGLVPPPLRGFTANTVVGAVDNDWRVMQGTTAQIRDELEHADMAHPEDTPDFAEAVRPLDMAMNVVGQAAAGGGN